MNESVITQKFFNHLFRRKVFLEKDFIDLVNNLNKLPKHTAISINEDTIRWQDVLKLIHWCHKSGVTHVSLFSGTGLFDSCNQLDSYLTNGKKNGINSCQQINGSLRHRTNGYNKPEENGKSKRYFKLEELNVCIVTEEDSRQSIVNLAKTMCKQTAPIDQNDITNQLKKTFDFPDPDLLITFGPSTSLLGYPIWQLRLTEMYFLPTHRDIQFNEFYEILCRFSKCEQRFGK